MSGSARWRIDREYENLLKEKARDEAKAQPLVTGGPVEFCEKVLGFKPTAYQERLLLDSSRFIVARWSRQSGKSYAIAALLLYSALANSGSRIAILAPSLRQAKKVVGRISIFLHKLPRWFLSGRALRTKLEFINDSTIEALPNNPETIRGDTLHLVFLDEMNYIQNDVELYDASVYSLMTTNGRFIGASTPGSKDSLFYAMCFDDEAFRNVSRHHVGYREALEPNGPLKPEILEQIHQQTLPDPSRWHREMEAEFSEDEDAWLPLALITKCVDHDLAPVSEAAVLEGRLPSATGYFVGADLGQKHDHSAVAVVEKRDSELRLAHMKQFKLGTEYNHVLGYLKSIGGSPMVRRTYIDQTGVGEMFMEEARKTGLKNTRGIMLTLPMKQEIMVYLRKVMEEGRLKLSFEPELISEMNVERYELTKTGQKQFSHPDGTHDDRLWALALAVYASRPEIPEYHPVALTGRVNMPWWMAFKKKADVKYARPGEATVTKRDPCLTCWGTLGPDGKCPRGHT